MGYPAATQRRLVRRARPCTRQSDDSAISAERQPPSLCSIESSIRIPICEAMVKERGRAILMLHGLCSSQLEVRLFARALGDAGFTVAVPVLAGYCAAEADPAETLTPPDYRRWIADAAAKVDELAATHSEVTICGISLGAT